VLAGALRAVTDSCTQTDNLIQSPAPKVCLFKEL
jgi:hypothetical protein